MSNDTVDLNFVVSGVSFNAYNNKEILRLSVLEITNQQTFDLIGHAQPNGLHDIRLGPNGKDEVCGTCSMGYLFCPGHCGHISLPLVVFNPFYFKELHKLVKGVCFNCDRLLAPSHFSHLLMAQLGVLQRGLVGASQELEQIVMETLKNNESSAAKNSLLMSHQVQMKIDEFMEKQAAKSTFSSERDACVKNVVEVRRRLIKRYIAEHLTKGYRKCVHCGTSKNRITVQDGARFISGEAAVTTNKSRPKKSLSGAGGGFSFNSSFEITREEDIVFAEEEQQQEKTQQKGDVLIGHSFLTSVEIRKHLRGVWENNKLVLRGLFGLLADAEKEDNPYPTDFFFLDVLLVPPSKFRPMAVMGGKRFENPLTTTYRRVMEFAEMHRNILTVLNYNETRMLPAGMTQLDYDRIQFIVSQYQGGSNVIDKMHFTWKFLQQVVNTIYDSESDKMSRQKTVGVKQILEKKEGLFRKFMMGKRVNYAARSVISPDPYISVDEIGIPMIFATRLSYPAPVTPRNAEQLRQAVINGPDNYPGALAIEMESGTIVRLNPDKKIQREALAKQLLTPNPRSENAFKPKIVHRHLQSGDVLLLNRQPTLHKPSIMAHKARVLPGEKTLRLHYANCKCYNADFDGDEMNAHFPQSELARAEAYNIASVNNQYLVPKDGTPLSGLIQDHVIAGSRLTLRGSFFSRDDYNLLVYGALTFLTTPIKLLPPAIVKPQCLWSGKQIVSTVLINCIPAGLPPPNLDGKAKIPGKAWVKGRIPSLDPLMEEDVVTIRDGELLCGIFDKAHYGPTQYGLVHICYELYGGETSSRILTAFARLFTHYLQSFTAFTLGIRDILVTPKADRRRRKIMRKARNQGKKVALDALNVNESEEMTDELMIGQIQNGHLSRTDQFLKQWDAAMKKHTDSVNNDINKVCIPDGLLCKFPDNNLQFMVQSGAKGGMVNCMQISCLLGQIELEGRRVPLMLSGRSLPSFKPYDTSPRAGGFIDGRFLTGIRPQEFFFHCMAGREGLVDTAVKTSRSGYLQRCLIKHLEGLSVGYDQTVRESDGSVIQFQYGEDGVDILRSQMLTSKQFPVMIQNAQVLKQAVPIERLKEAADTEKIEELKKKVHSWRRKLEKIPEGVKNRVSEFTRFCEKREATYKQLYPESSTTKSDIPIYKQKMIEEFHDLQFTDERFFKKLSKHIIRTPNPVNAELRSGTTFGVVSERLDSLIEDYIKKNEHSLIVGEDAICYDVDADEMHDSSKISEDQKRKNCKPISSDLFRDLVYARNQHALACPGEPVGLLAAQSIGEPSTQMTLNTFHFAGRGEMNVTLGIPRMREILMTASQNISTPSMNLHLRNVPNIEQRAERRRVALTVVRLNQLLELVTVQERIDVLKLSERARLYTVRFQFLPYKAYKRDLYATPNRILKFMESKFLKTLVSALKSRLATMKESKNISTARQRMNPFRQTEAGGDPDDPSYKPPGNGKDDEGESSEDEGGEGDTTETRQRDKHMDDLDYEEPEDEEFVPEKDEQLLSDDEGESVIEREGDESSVGVEGTSTDASDSEQSNAPFSQIEDQLRKKRAKDLLKEKPVRVNSVKNYHPWIYDYDFDTEREEWCCFTFKLPLQGSKLDFISLVDDLCKKEVFHSVPNLQRAFLVKDLKDKSGCGKMLQTEGVNFIEMVNHDDIVDMRRISSNDIHAIWKFFGIEAATRAIVQEVSNVFAVYGIEVNQRHLSLVADYMTFDGTFRAYNRIHMESSASPLQQMTFETTATFMKNATLSGVKDLLVSPSARIILGQIVGVGSGVSQMKPIAKGPLKLKEKA